MKMFLNHRVLPFVCALSILVSILVVPVFAAEFPDGFRDYDAVNDWSAEVSSHGQNPGFVKVMSALGVGSDPQSIFWSLVNARLKDKCEETSYEELEILAATFNEFFTGTLGETFGEQVLFGTYNIALDYVSKHLIGNWEPHFVVKRDVDGTGFVRIYEETVGLFVVNSAGAYPYADLAEDDFSSDQWVPISYIHGGKARMVPYEALFNTASIYGKSLVRYGEYWIIKKGNSGAVDYVLGDKEGYAYVARANKDEWAADQDRKPTTGNITENGDIVEGDFTDNSMNLNLEGMTMILPDGTFQFIDKVIYDESTKSYHIDSHDTYNYTVNNYYTWNYYINYTSITYIGQTEEYNKYYEVYYELPDGRDSADLTKEDLEQLNLSVDVIPYGRSADDTSLRSLYHFDGDTKDSSYWNYCTRFNWRMGPSLTYMDTGVFGGALYLDENLHEFQFYLPSNIGISDFTVQFRYYQSATLTPVTDSYIYVGGRVVCYMNGSHFVGINGETLAEIPVGTWSEIAVVRENGRVRVYLNGHMIYGVTINDAFSDLIELHFGSEQQTYKYIDELRVLNYSLQTDGLPYECTRVPYDTNLILVLPDSAVPVADEYWSFDQTITPAWSKDFSTGYSDAFSADIVMTPQNYFEGHLGRVQYISSATSVTEYEGFASVVSHSTPTLPPSGAGTGLIIPISGYRTTPEYFDFTGFKSRYQTGGNSGTHTFSLVTRDGETYSLTFDMFYPIYMENRVRASASFDWGSIYYIEYSNVLTYILVVPNKGVPLDFVYMEIVKGSTPNTGHEFVQSVTGIDKDDLNTPTLAVRTDIDITSYQIGGVRPSLPKKGMVWAMVENERIASLQIYNGQAWDGVDGRIWTGERWIPMSSYNIITLQDMYDIVDATPNYEYIYSEAGFWSWWQKSWNAFTEKLFATLGTGATGSGGATLNPETAPAVPDDEATGEKGYSIIDLFVVLKDGTWAFITGVVSTAYDGFSGFVESVSSAGSFFTFYDTESDESIFFIPLEEGETIWD